MFSIAAAIYLFGAIIYLILSSGEQQAWAEISGGYEPHVNPDNEDKVTEYEAVKEMKAE